MDRYLFKLLKVFSFSLKPILQDVFSLMTPGGGGYGRAKNDNNRLAEEDETEVARKKYCPNQQYLQTGSVYTYNLAQESA